MESATNRRAAPGDGPGRDPRSPDGAAIPAADRQGFYEVIFARMGDAVLVADDDGRYLDANPAAEMLLGRSRDAITRMQVADVVIDIDPTVETRWSRFRGVGTDTGRVRLRHADGHEMVCDYHATADIAPGVHVAILRDVTERLDADASERRAERMESITRLAGGVAHDFNNLLTVVTGHLALLEDLPDLPHEARQHLQQIADAAARATALSGQLLALGRRQALRPTVTPIAEVLDHTIGMLTAVLDGQPAVELELIAPDAQARVDATRFARAIVELVLHLSDADPGLERVMLTLDRMELDEVRAAQLGVPAGPAVRVAVDDDGRGIEPELLAHVFEPFVVGQPDAVARGLGLASIHGVVTQSGGSITVMSSTDMGTRFEILLPEVEPEHEEASHHDAASSGQPSRSAAHGGVRTVEDRSSARRPTGTILLVDDDPGVRRVIEQILLRAGWVVDALGDGHAALEALSTGRHDAMVTDLVMPSMNGRELVRRARALQPELPVLLVTGRAGDLLDDDLATGTPLDVEVLHKPFTAQQFLGRLRNVLAAPRRT